MANVIPNDKGFKVLELSMEEFQSIGGLSMCDGCNQAMFKGYYISVLNYSYCEEDYKNWEARSIKYDEDIPYELSNFNRMKQLLKVQ